ncbi:MAG: magnesium transporter [Nitrospirota bacterium]
MALTKYDIVLDTFRRLLRRGAISNISKIVDKMHPADVAKVIRHLTLGAEKRTILDLVRDAKTKADVISEIDATSRNEIFSEMPSSDIVAILKDLRSDDVADIVGDMQEDKAKEILNMMKEEDSEEVEDLLRYPEETAGGIMTPDFFSLTEDTTAQEAIAKLQQASDAEMVFYIYVTDKEGKLVGVISLRQILMVPPNTPLKKIMTVDVLSVNAEMDQEEVARMVARYNLLAIPVVDKENRLVGIITVDDIVDVIREEATEDIHKMAGTTEEETVFGTSTINTAKFRIRGNLTYLLGGIIASIFLWIFRFAIQEVIALASFLPVITAMGGNIGLQSSTIVVRGLATGRIELSDVWKVFSKELRVGSFMGIICGGIVGIIARFWHGNVMLGIVVGVSMFVGITVAAIMGTLIPIILKSLNRDPAVSSGPFVTTANDITGLVIYLSLANYLLNYLR